MNNTIFNAETRRRGDIDKAENRLADTVIDAAIEVHRVLGGPGLLESLYEDAFLHELQSRGIPVQSQVRIPVKYKDKVLRDPLRIDLLVANRLIIEIKALEKIPPHSQSSNPYLSETNRFEARIRHQLWPKNACRWSSSSSEWLVVCANASASPRLRVSASPR